MRQIILLCTVLAGCGGAGGPVVQPVDFDAFHADITAQDVTPASFVPTGGSHNYAGLMQLNLPLGAVPAETYQGEFEISLAFDSANVAALGNAEGFVSESGNTLAGALAFDGGVLVLSADPDRDFLLFADIEGRLMDDGVSYDLVAEIAADIYGMDADGFAGVIFSGTISQGDNIDIFDGTFAGEKMR